MPRVKTRPEAMVQLNRTERGAAAKPDNLQLRGMSYADGARALAPGQTRGSAGIVSSSSVLEVTSVGDFTPALTERLQGDQMAPLDAVLRQASELVIEDTNGTLQHPSLAMVGNVAGATFGQGPSRRATFVANYLYENIMSVPTLGESRALEGALKARGFPTERQDNLDRSGLQQTLLDPLASARPGDEVFLHYVGHGTQEGLLGVKQEWDRPDILEHGVIAGALSAAAAGGAHVRLVETACMSGHGPLALRDKEFERVSPSADAHWRGMHDSLMGVINKIEGVEGKLGAMIAKAERETDKLRGWRAGEDGASHKRRIEEANAIWKRMYAEVLAQAERFWASLRPTLINIANEVAGGDRRPPVEIPVKAPMQAPKTRESINFTYGSMLDPIYDLDNRLLALMGGPKGKIGS